MQREGQRAGRRLPLLLSMMVVAGLLVAGCGVRAQDHEQFSPDERLVLRFSHVEAENTPKGQAARRFAALVKDRTQGRVEVQVFPNSSLYSETDEVGALQGGRVQVIAPDSSTLSAYVPIWQIFDLPYAFPEAAAVDRLMAGPLGLRLREDLEAQGVVMLGYWHGGFVSFTNSRRPLVLPEDFRGLRFRTPPAEVPADTLRAMGGIPVPLPLKDVYQALDRGQVDGQESTPATIWSKRMYEVQGHMTLSQHAYALYVVLVQAQQWAGIPPEIREVLREALSEVSQWVREQAPQINAEAMTRLQISDKIRIHIPSPLEREQWVAALGPAYDLAAARLGRDVVAAVRANTRGMLLEETDP